MDAGAEAMLGKPQQFVKTAKAGAGYDPMIVVEHLARAALLDERQVAEYSGVAVAEAHVAKRKGEIAAKLEALPEGDPSSAAIAPIAWCAGMTKKVALYSVIRRGSERGSERGSKRGSKRGSERGSEEDQKEGEKSCLFLY